MRSDICPDCGKQIVSLEIRGIYDGTCAWCCTSCEYYEVRTGYPFEKHKESIIETVQRFQKRDNKNE